MSVFYEIYNDDNDPLYEMANIHPKNSGLKYKIYISKEPSVEHNIPRLKVNLDGNEWYPITIDDTNPQWLTDNVPQLKHKQFQSIQQFIIMNYDILIQLWNDEIDAVDFSKKIKKV